MYPLSAPQSFCHIFQLALELIALSLVWPWQQSYPAEVESTIPPGFRGVGWPF
jgi:hypothetical protein